MGDVKKDEESTHLLGRLHKKVYLCPANNQMKKKYMNKKFAASALLLAGAMFGMVSCNKDTSFHATSVDYPYNGLLYADQTLDSIIFSTTDDWSLATPFDWIHIQGSLQGQVKDQMAYYTLSRKVQFDENTTDSTRIGHIELSSYYNSAALYVQMGFIDISHPRYTVKSYYGNTNVPTKVTFTMADSASVTLDSICFNARKDWSLELTNSGSRAWVTANKTSGSAGKQSIRLTMEQNPDTLARETKAILTSGAVRNEITIRQFGQKPKKD